MLRTLIDEVRNRRMLAFAALGVLVALALPLLFLKSAPEGAPEANSAAPAAATEAKLPARAARLLATTDAGAPGGRAKGSAQDPFAPPSSYRAAAAAAAGGGEASKSANTSKSSSGGSTSQPAPAVVNSPPSSSSPKPSSSKPNPSPPSSGSRAVDVRYGANKDTKIRRSIPRYKAFYIHGKLVAVFVKYSPSLNKAVFAVAPGLHISGPVKCRVQDGVCKYLDIPAGSHARLTMITADKAVVSRRLDVVRTKARRSSGTTSATAASAHSEPACLVRKLVAMKPGDSLIARDACES